jgi:hypothetical protein
MFEFSASFKLAFMKNFKTGCSLTIILLLLINVIQAQPKVRVVAGMIALDDGTVTPKEVKYVKLVDSLNRNLKTDPNDTTNLFYRALLYLRYNSLAANPDLTSNQATGNLLQANKMVDRADSL